MHLSAILHGLDGSRLTLMPVAVDDSALAGAPIEKRYPREMYYRLFAARLCPAISTASFTLTPTWWCWGRCAPCMNWN